MRPLDFLKHINTHNFESFALETFDKQYASNPIYRQYVDTLRRPRPRQLAEIPFLPISFFKSHEVKLDSARVEKVFLSSGTTGQERSRHYVTDLNWYNASLLQGFENVFGPMSDFVFIALLPSYLENGDSSLIYMLDQLIHKSGSSLSGFYSPYATEISQVVTAALEAGKRPFVFGVAYALLDLAAAQLNLSKAIVLETGGMKGRREEITKEALHAALQLGFGLERIYSEYGMTELLSQAYSFDHQTFSCPPWMQIRIRDVYDPFTEVPFGQKGGINVIDLANQNSCAFIQTDDLGRLTSEGFKLEGRLAATDIRGCNLLVD